MRKRGRDLEPDEGFERPASAATWLDPVGARLITWSLAALAVVVLAAWLLLAFVHVDDRFMVDHVSGVRMALARYANNGTLYPDLYRDGFYGGTRFMPLPILAHAALADATEEYLISGKLLGYLTIVGLVITTYAILRRRGCPAGLSLSLSVLVLTTGAGLAASMNMRSDVLPLLLQLIAVWIVAEDKRPLPAAAAGGLSALASMSKLSAVWAPIAIVVWLLPRDRRRLGWYMAAYAVAAGGLFALFAAVSGGRIVENVFGLATAGINSIRSVVLAPYRFIHLIVDDATTMWAVVPLAIMGAWGGRRRELDSIYVVSTICALAVSIVVLMDIGTGANQLLDLIVLLAIVIGESAAWLDRRGASEARRTLPVAALAGLTVLWCAGTGAIVTLAPPVLSKLQGEAAATARPLSDTVRPGSSILSEDPYVPISLGRAPVVLDPFMLPRLASKVPEAIPDLIARIEAKEFDLVVLVEPLEPLDRSWWTELDLGRAVVRAISRAYVYVGARDGYFLYAPRPPDAVP